MKMKIIRKISGLFLAFMLLFAVLFVIAPQEEVKADEINTLQDLSNTSWILNNKFVASENFDIKLNSSTSNTVIMELMAVNNFDTMTLVKSNITSNNGNFFTITKSSNYSMTANINGTAKIIYLYMYGSGGFQDEFNGEAQILNIYDMSNVTENSTNLSFVEWLKLNATLNTANKYKGTQVLNTGTLEYLYFNTLLPNSEIDNILSTLNYYEGDFGELVYPVAISTYAEISLIVDKYGSEYSISVSGQLEIYNSLTGFTNEFENPFNAYGIPLDSELQGIVIGNENDKLSSLFSTSPFEIVNYNYITIIDDVNNTYYEIEYQEGYTLEENNIYLNALEYKEVEANSPFSNLVNVYKKFTGWSISSLSGVPRSYDITLPFTFTSQYSGEDWLLLPQYEDIDYIPFNLIVNNVREGVDSEAVSIWGAIPVINNEVVINNNMLAYLDYSLIIGAEVNDEEAPPTINYKANVLFNNLALNNNQIILSSDVNSSNIIAVELTYLSNAIISANGSTTGENVVSYYKNYNISGNYTDTINIVDRTTNAYIEIKIAVRNNTPVDNGDINVKSAFTTFFSLVGGFLSMKLGFITLGEIIGLVLAIALLGFIFKVWNGGNNG